jgi:tyrosinase
LAQGRKNPDDSRWLDQTFEFYDPGGTKVTQTPRQVVSTEALGYRYDDDPPPSAVPLTALVPEQAEAALELVQAITVRADNPEEIGTSAPLELGTGVTAARIPLAEMPEANLALLAAPDTSPSRVAMVVDEITLDDPEAPIYEIYLNMPDVGGGGHHDSPNFVGFLEFFGVGHGHGGHSEGAKRVFDITSVVHMLQQSGEWDPAHVDVSFVPARTLEDPETNSLMPAPVVGSPTVHVGAIRIVVE